MSFSIGEKISLDRGKLDTFNSGTFGYRSGSNGVPSHKFVHGSFHINSPLKTEIEERGGFQILDRVKFGISFLSDTPYSHGFILSSEAGFGALPLSPRERTKIFSGKPESNGNGLRFQCAGIVNKIAEMDFEDRESKLVKRASVKKNNGKVIQSTYTPDGFYPVSWSSDSGIEFTGAYIEFGQRR